MAGKRVPVSTGVTEPKRLDQRDPRLPVADMFDPQIARRLWDSLPPDCQRDHFNKKTMPQRYRSAVPEVSAGGPWTACYLNFSGLPEPMTWEIAWSIHREIELGHSVHPNTFNAMTRILRTATSGGTKRGRTVQSLLQLTPEEWMREAHAARMRGYEQGEGKDHVAQARIRQLQDVLVYPYHQGLWWQLNVWNPMLDNRIPRREHEPMGANNASFTRLSSDWLREAAKLWLSANLSTGRYSWSTIKSRLDALKWLQRYIDQRGDEGPCLTADPHALRPFIRGFCDMLATHRIKVGKNTGQLLGKNPRRHVMVAIEQFYQWMYDHRDEAPVTLGMPAWGTLRPEHCVLFRPEDKPRLTNKRTSEVMILDDDVMRRIAEGCDVLARPRAAGGLGDIQAFHALMLLMRTGRRMNEVLMMDFDPLEPFHHTTREHNDADDSEAFVARMRYQQTKVESTTPASIPVDAEIVAIIKAQQEFAKAFLAAAGEPDRTPKYLFLRATKNRLGTNPYPAATLHMHLGELTETLAITDSAGRPVAISQTHRFRHTAATNLLNAGVPLHVVMRYFGHVSPEMTLHYAVTLSQTMEDEFLKYKKVTRDGRTADIDPTDLYEQLHLDKRADRILPNGWCTLPPKQLCDKGNACLGCSVFVTDASHATELRRQLHATERLVDTRQTTFTAKYGAPMGEDNIWLKGRRDEIASLNRILLSITDITDHAVRGPGVNDQTA